MKSPVPILALACLLAVACTRGNPAFEREARQPSVTPARDRAPEPGPASLPSSEAGADERGATTLPVDASPDQPSGPADVLPVTDQAQLADAARPDLSPADASPPDSSLAGGLVVRYPLDPAAASAVPDDRLAVAGTRQGGASWASSGFPGARFDNAGSLALDGATGYATLPTTGLPAIAGTKSVSLWFWQATPTISLRKTLLALSNPDEALGLQLGLQGGVPSVWIWAQLIGTAVVAAGQSSPAGWTHLAYVQQGTQHTLYVNGSPAGSRSVTLRSGPVTSFMLGGYAPDAGRDERWGGRIDDVRIYGRALTLAEIELLAAGGL